MPPLYESSKTALTGGADEKTSDRLVVDRRVVVDRRCRVGTGTLADANAITGAKWNTETWLDLCAAARLIDLWRADRHDIAARYADDDRLDQRADDAGGVYRSQQRFGLRLYERVSRDTRCSGDHGKSFRRCKRIDHGRFRINEPLGLIDQLLGDHQRNVPTDRAGSRALCRPARRDCRHDGNASVGSLKPLEHEQHVVGHERVGHGQPSEQRRIGHQRSCGHVSECQRDHT